MELPRLQLVELNDQSWVPALLRDTIVESLSLTLRWGRILDGLVDPLLDFLREAEATEVLELGSGGGGPARALAESAERRGVPLRMLLTDLFPRPEAWEELRRRHPERIDYVTEPVDATRIPAALSHGRARVIINTFHHLPPELARSVIASACAAGAPLFIAEGFPRNPLRFLPFAPAGIAALAASPLFAKKQRTARAALVWGTPIALLASIFDGFVSTMRVYTEGELREMARDAKGYRWRWGTYPFAPFGLGTFFYVVPA